nr:unnamed protein product [Naegleria fowleri]
MTSYPSSKNLITGKAALSESEDEDNSYDPESSIEPNHVEILMSFKKRYTNKHFSYIRTLVCKLINGETFTTLAQKRQNAEYFYRIDDISLGRAKYAIPVVNEKDFSKFTSFEYSNTTDFGEGISKETKENVAALKNIEFCDCKKKCGKGCKCLQLQRDYRFDSNNQSEKFQSVRRGDDVYYDENKRLKDTNTKYIIVECNSECSCPDTCPNRVVQKGSDVKVTIFKTNRTGWGLRAAQKLHRGQFVEIYAGELISDEVGEMRGRYYDRKGLSYLFDVSHGDVVCDFTVDSTYKGNVTRFLNHSCDGNLQQYLVCSEIRDSRYGTIAFFCKRNIEVGEELTFDYHYVCEKQVRCLCGSKNCKQWLR